VQVKPRGARDRSPVTAFLPLSRRGKESAIQFEQLVEDIPDYLAPSLYEWVKSVEADREAGLEHGQVVARLLRVTIDPKWAYPTTVFWGGATAAERLDVIDLFLRLFGNNYVHFNDDGYGSGAQVAERLEWILSSGGSAWRVSFGEPYELVKRVDGTIQNAAKAVIDQNDDPGAAIARAWSNCYGRSPNYDEAYRNLVLAVESVLHPLAAPMDLRATLGKATAHIGATKDKWTVGGMDNGADALLDLLSLIWTNQERHARPDGTIRGVGKEEAEVALSAALTVVQWANAGAIRKAS